MIVKRFSFAINALLIVGSLCIPASSFAQSSAVFEARQTAKNEIQKVEAKDEESSFGSKKEDLADNLKATISIVDLMKAESADVLTKLAVLVNSKDEKLSQYASVLSLRVRVNNAYIALVRSQLDSENLDEKSLGDLVSDLKDWRVEVYEPAMTQALNANLLNQGADALVTVKSRLDKVAMDVVKLQKTYGQEAKPLLAMLESAQMYAQRAQKAYDQAQSLFTKEYDLFISNVLPVESGFSEEMEFTNGEKGELICMPRLSGVNAGACMPVFRFNDGSFYLLLKANGQEFSDLSSGVYKVSGPTAILKTSIDKNLPSGAIIVVQSNRKETSLEKDKVSATDGLANVLDTVIQKKGVGTVRSFIEAEIKAITSVYKTLFTMAKTANALMKK